jgi:putative ABC transport system ATP-binding protein
MEISARGLEKVFDDGHVRALDGVDLDIAAGEHTAVTGPTGSGKSTLLSLLALLERADAGELLIDGRPAASITPAEAWRGRNVGIVFQFHHLLPYLTAEENVLLPLIGRGVGRGEARHRASAILDAVGLAHRADFVVTKLSGGERQLTAVARALVGRPRLILADEPTGSVDSRTGERILSLLLDGEITGGATIVLVTHDMAVADRAGRRRTMLDGRIIATGEGS